MISVDRAEVERYLKVNLEKAQINSAIRRLPVAFIYDDGINYLVHGGSPLTVPVNITEGAIVDIYGRVLGYSMDSDEIAIREFFAAKDRYISEGVNRRFWPFTNDPEGLLKLEHTSQKQTGLYVAQLYLTRKESK